MTGDERRQALAVIADEITACTRCRLHEGRTRAVPGEGDPDTEVVFVGEGPGFNEDREGRPFVGRAGGLLVRLLASIGWRREDVFITNVVKCRPPDNRDPQPDEIAACAPYLQHQLATLDPAVVVTLGRYSMAAFMPGVRIGQVHGTTQPIDPETGARDALAFAMYHPAAALRTQALERESFEDIARVPGVLLRARERREAATATEATATEATATPEATATEAAATPEATATEAAATPEATATEAASTVATAEVASDPRPVDEAPRLPVGPHSTALPALAVDDEAADDASQLTLF